MNIWKWLFMGLLLVNAGIIIWLSTALGGDYQAPSAENDNYTPEESGIEVKMNNDAMESIINDAIDDESLAITVDEEQIALDVVRQVIGLSIETSVELEPVSTGEEVVFELVDINISDLPLSQNMMYGLIKDQSDLPEGISFRDDERALVIDSEVFTEQLEWDVRVDSIDYEDDEWYFSITR